jgi:hypothetical protein
MGAALRKHRTVPAQFFGAFFTRPAGPTALAFGGEKHRRINTPTARAHLPIPVVAIGPRQLLWQSHTSS